MKEFALLVINILFFTIFAHVILSWLIVAGVRNDTVLRLYQTMGMALDPLYRPLRRFLPATGALDLAPLVTIVVLIILQRAIISLG